jgi:hypothetical protein
LARAAAAFTLCQQTRRTLAGMNRGIWILATWLVQKHGADAPYAVHERIMAMRHAMIEQEHIDLWLMVDDAVRAWLKTAPSPQDTIH